MHNEYEITILDIDVNGIENKLQKLGAIKEGDYFQKRNLYNFHEKFKGRFIRLRTNGKSTILTIKDKSAKKDIGSVKELEIEVSDFDKTALIMEQLGYEVSTYQENKRTIYKLGNVEFDIDTWPMIPTYMEIEGKSKEEVEDFIEKLKIDKSKLTLDKVSEIYKKYGIDIHDYKELKF
jgi:adenylate cyclase, class 2